MSTTKQLTESQSTVSIVQKRKPRLIQLDFLRGIAILLVLGVHSPTEWHNAGLGKPIAAFFVRFGWAGVDLFFVLSGFLVGGLLLKELLTSQHLDVKRFIIRRAFKIWPSYYLYLTVMLIVFTFQSHGQFIKSFHSLMPDFFHYQNYVDQPLGQMWSLAIEEHFYLLLPLLLISILAFTGSATTALKFLPYFVLGCVFSCTILRVILLWHKPFDYMTHMMPTHLRIDGLCFGVFLAYLYHAQKSIWNSLVKYRMAIIITSLLLILPMVVLNRMRSPFVTTLGYTFLYLGFGGLLVILMQTQLGIGKLGKFLGTRIASSIAWIGTHSYPIYLWHVALAINPVKYALEHHWLSSMGTLAWILANTVFVLLAIYTGAGASYLVEGPLLSLRDKLFPARSNALNL